MAGAGLSGNDQEVQAASVQPMTKQKVGQYRGPRSGGSCQSGRWADEGGANRVAQSRADNEVSCFSFLCWSHLVGPSSLEPPQLTQMEPNDPWVSIS